MHLLGLACLVASVSLCMPAALATSQVQDDRTSYHEVVDFVDSLKGRRYLSRTSGHCPICPHGLILHINSYRNESIARRPVESFINKILFTANEYWDDLFGLGNRRSASAPLAIRSTVIHNTLPIQSNSTWVAFSIQIIYVDRLDNRTSLRYQMTSDFLSSQGDLLTRRMKASLNISQYQGWTSKLSSACQFNRIGKDFLPEKHYQSYRMFAAKFAHCPGWVHGGNERDNFIDDDEDHEVADDSGSGMSGDRLDTSACPKLQAVGGNAQEVKSAFWRNQCDRYIIVQCYWPPMIVGPSTRSPVTSTSTLHTNSVLLTNTEKSASTSTLHTNSVLLTNTEKSVSTPAPHATDELLTNTEKSAGNEELLGQGDNFTMHLLAGFIASGLSQEDGAHDHTAAVNQLLASLNSDFWIVHGPAAFKQHRSRCVGCKKLWEKPATQQMASLPTSHAQKPLRAFSRVGLDYAGPFYIKQERGRSWAKRYMYLFTCLQTRAVHLEMASSLDTESFLQAFARFSKQRGVPDLVVSDNGRNFVAAEGELRQAVNSLDQSKIASTMAGKGVKWRFNTPLTPHHGDILEAMVKSSKRDLIGILSKLWRRWLNEMVQALKLPQDWQKKHAAMKIGDVVLVREDHTPIGQWLLGRIEAVYPGVDGIIGVVDVRVKDKLYQRPVALLVPIDAEETQRQLSEYAARSMH